MFTLGEEWWQIVLRAAVVYLAVLLGLRFVGRRSLGQRTALDVVLILIVANAVQNAMIGSDTSLPGGLIAAGTLFVVDRYFGDLLERHEGARKMFEGVPVILIHNGHLVEEQLRRQRISLDELQETLDEHGIEHISQVKLAILEMDGSLSIIPAEADSSRTSRKLRRQQSS
jgi:uncharacterized membrane protein YcaP (DUF421 family)